MDPVLASFSRAQMLTPFIVGDIDPVVRISLRRGMKWFISTSSGSFYDFIGEATRAP
jgi:hypothetical protein